MFTATTDAIHDASPNRANPNRHKRIGRRVDKRNTRKCQTCNHSPSPSMRMLVERQGPGSASRLTLPKESVDALCVLLFTVSAFVRVPPVRKTGTTENPGKIAQKTRLSPLSARRGRSVPMTRPAVRLRKWLKGTDGKVKSIQVDIGRMLGIGSKVVTITPDKFEQLAGIKLRLSDAEIRSLPEAKK